MIERAAVLLIGIFAFLTLANIAILLSNVVFRQRSSMIFLFGGLFGAVGFLLMPSLRCYAWLPPLVDPASAAFLIYGLPGLLQELWRTSRFNLVSEYAGRSGIREVQLCLYHKQIFVLRQSFARSPGELGVVGHSIVGSWHKEDDRLLLQFGDQIAAFEPLSCDGGRSIRQCGEASLCETNLELSLSEIELVCESGGAA